MTEQIASTTPDNRPPLVVLGPTASGKTGLALALAQATAEAHIVSADAMAVYARMDIGTAKPTEAERLSVVHHGIDIVDASEECGVATYNDAIRPVIESLDATSTPFILAGGTGLYIRSIVDAFELPGTYPEVVLELESEPHTEKLWQRLHALDPMAAAKMEPNNRRRVMRALEVCVGSGRPFSSFGPGVDAYPPSRFVQIGLEIDRELMDRRIDERYEHQMAAGFLAEVEALLRTDLSRPARQALGYRELIKHLEGHCTLDEALDEAKRRTHRFARRQQRWFRRDPRIHWLPATAPDLVERAQAIWAKGEPADVNRSVGAIISS
ncbi:MAG: tRNA (adenosine(37)-N6)-dimethylallyltransferase MiaA [Acidimicrobiales bacterium]